MMANVGAFTVVASLALNAAAAHGQSVAPEGLAAAALANREYSWITRQAPGFRAYFLTDSYPARHQDSLLARLDPALSHARSLIGAAPLKEPVDVFFIETRAQMRGIVGAAVTGFAQPSARAVFLVTNPEWRAFERHEVAHVVVGQAWGRAAPNMDWLVEGIAQAADGTCGGFTNSDVAIALAERHGWLPFDDLLLRFRAQGDLRAYLQAAAFAAVLLRDEFASALSDLWKNGATRESAVGGRTLGEIEASWRGALRATRTVPAAQLDVIEERGCG
ncbi:MAG: hypothetical protein ABIZ91_15330 [Gemmatimonadaceae bacterium]